MTDVVTNVDGRPLSRRGLDTRRRLLDAAERVFGELGFHDASIVKVADAAGVAAGDVVTSIGDQRVTDMADLVAAIARRRPGDPVTVALWRGDEQLHKDAALGTGP